MSKKVLDAQITELTAKLQTVDSSEVLGIIAQINDIMSHTHDADTGRTLVELAEQLNTIGEKKIANDYSNLQKQLGKMQDELQGLIGEVDVFRREAGTALIELQKLEKEYDQQKKELERKRYGAQTQENYKNQEIQAKQQEIEGFKRVHNLQG